MMLGSCNALTQITKMLHGPAQIFDFQFSVFSQILYSSSSCYFNLLSFIELPLKFETLKKPNKLPFFPSVSSIASAFSMITRGPG